MTGLFTNFTDVIFRRFLAFQAIINEMLSSFLHWTLSRYFMGRTSDESHILQLYPDGGLALGSRAG
jgi:hypothetical protein